MTKFLLDNKGKWVGSVSEMGGRTTYLDDKGKLVARIHDGKTFDSKGSFKGFGDQGQRLFGKK